MRSGPGCQEVRREVAWVPTMPFVNAELQEVARNVARYVRTSRKYNPPFCITSALANANISGRFRTSFDQMCRTTTEIASTGGAGSRIGAQLG